MNCKTITSITLAVSAVLVAPGAFAAAGDRSVVGIAGPPTVNESLGNNRAGISYAEVATGVFSQEPGAANGPQRIELNGLSYRSLNGVLEHNQFNAFTTLGQAIGTREGSHMTGLARGRIILKNNLIWQDDKDFDVTTWAGSEAEVLKNETIYSYESPEFKMGVSIGVASIEVTARYSGSIALNVSASSDFRVSNGRHGIALASQGGSLALNTVASASASVLFGLAGVGVTTENKLGLTYPATAFATWDYSSALPISRRNSYSAAGAFPLSASASGKFYVFGSLFGIKKTSLIADWNKPNFLETIVKSGTASDVGAYE
jgi:hypothetical protein